MAVRRPVSRRAARERAEARPGRRTSSATRLDGQLQTSMAEFDGMLLEASRRLLEEKQRTDPLPDAAAGHGRTGPARRGRGEGESDGLPGRRAARTTGRPRRRGRRRGRGRREAGRPTGRPAPARRPGPPTPRPGGSTTPAEQTAGRRSPRPSRAAARVRRAGHAPCPADVGDGKDDDVVARQLREAAMKEKDPAIREKLWEEYREYKKGTGKGG